jgi:1-acyl-sn-glycerol-3-phosphate acyltransferase
MAGGAGDVRGGGPTPSDDLGVDPRAIDTAASDTAASERAASAGDEGRTGPVLGRDPFEMASDFDPFIEGLAALGRDLQSPAAGALQSPAASARSRVVDEAVVEEPAAEEPTPLRRRRWTSAPPLAEIDTPDPSGLLERWLGNDERRRLAALQHLVEGEVAYDRFGMSPDTLRTAFPFFYALYRLYFRVQSRGHENVPAHGPAILASNHGGLLPFDGAMLIIDLLLNTDPPRLARSIVDRWAGDLPFVNVFYARVGQVVGTRENFADLLGDGQLVLVFPEGVAGIRKTITQRNRLQSFHIGFVEEALRAGTPIVPTAVVGSDDQAPILHDFPKLAKRLGLPAFPITPTFPLLGPLGLLPYPVRYRIVYGEPMAIHERFGPEDAQDPRLVRYLARQVRHRVQQLVDSEQ